MTVFIIDGQKHAVTNEDSAIIHGPFKFTGGGWDFAVKAGETCTLLFTKIQPGGELVVNWEPLPPTVFYKPRLNEATTEHREMVDA